MSTEVPSALSGSKGIARAEVVSTRIVCAAAFCAQAAAERSRSTAKGLNAFPQGSRIGLNRTLLSRPEDARHLERITEQRENTVLFRFNKAKRCDFRFERRIVLKPSETGSDRAKVESPLFLAEAGASCYRSRVTISFPRRIPCRPLASSNMQMPARKYAPFMTTSWLRARRIGSTISGRPSLTIRPR